MQRYGRLEGKVNGKDSGAETIEQQGEVNEGTNVEARQTLGKAGESRPCGTRGKAVAAKASGGEVAEKQNPTPAPPAELAVDGSSIGREAAHREECRQGGRGYPS